MDNAPVTVSDVDSANLASATVSISNLLDSGLETLTATTTGTSITASYVAPTYDPLGQRHRAHHYQLGAPGPSPTATGSAEFSTTRTLNFVANDSALDSTTATKSVDVTAVNDSTGQHRAWHSDGERGHRPDL